MPHVEVTTIINLLKLLQLCRNLLSLGNTKKTHTFAPCRSYNYY
nr:MAG TPA: Huntingtin protein-like protein [Microviridae sp.]